MGKLILISGGNGSGKSRYAEALISHTCGPRYYIATMESQTEENRMRIQKHICQRAGLGFTTLELPTDIAAAPVEENSIVLLEDVSNLLGNTIFKKSGNEDDVLQEISDLLRRCRLLVAVTISGLTPDTYTGETAAYIHSLNTLNGQLLSMADAAAVMKDHCPVWEKGAEDAAF